MFLRNRQMPLPAPYPYQGAIFVGPDSNVTSSGLGNLGGGIMLGSLTTSSIPTCYTTIASTHSSNQNVLNASCPSFIPSIHVHSIDSNADHMNSVTNNSGGINPSSVPKYPPINDELVRTINDCPSKKTAPILSSRSDSALLKTSGSNQENDEIAKLRARIQELEREKQGPAFQSHCNTDGGMRQYEWTHGNPSEARQYQPYPSEPRQLQDNYQAESRYYPDLRYYQSTETSEPGQYRHLESRTNQMRTESATSQETYKSRLPYYNGKGDWKSFMVQFQIIAERNNWSPRQQADEIMLVLKDEALHFAT